MKGIYKKVLCMDCSAISLKDKLEPHKMFSWNKKWSDCTIQVWYSQISIGHGITSLKNFMMNNYHISDHPHHASKFIH